MKKCSVCGQQNLPMTIFVSAETNESDLVCMNCQAKDTADDVSGLEEADYLIEELESMALQLEGIIKRNPQPLEGDKQEEVIGFTPLIAYKSMQAFLASLKSRRMELMTDEDSDTRLQYELQKSLEKEDFEAAKVIQEKLK